MTDQANKTEAKTEQKEVSFKWKVFNINKIPLKKLAHAPHVSVSKPIIVFDTKLGITEAFVDHNKHVGFIIARNSDGAPLVNVTHYIELTAPK